MGQPQVIALFDHFGLTTIVFNLIVSFFIYLRFLGRSSSCICFLNLWEKIEVRIIHILYDHIKKATILNS